MVQLELKTRLGMIVKILQTGLRLDDVLSLLSRPNLIWAKAGLSHLNLPRKARFEFTSET